MKELLSFWARWHRLTQLIVDCRDGCKRGLIDAWLCPLPGNNATSLRNTCC
jgi:hypothetical protein